MRTANIQTALELRAISLAAHLDLRMGFVARSANGDKIHKANVLFNRKKRQAGWTCRHSRSAGYGRASWA